MTEEYLTQRAKMASRDKFTAALDAVPDTEPELRDKM